MVAEVESTLGPIALAVMPVAESAFGYASDIRLMELSGAGHPLLSRLMLETPGTFHHSVVVGTLAEAGALAIGANPVLCRVAALYHDVGKLGKAQYFSENQAGAATAAKIGKLVGARYMVMGTFVDFYGDFRVDVRLVSVETSEIVKTEAERMQRDHLFDIVRTVAGKLMRDANLPALPRQTSDQRMSRQVPTEALTYYSRAILYQNRGQKDKAVEMYNQALTVFPDYTEAKEGLQRVQQS